MRGFTLIEILVVMVILAILAATLTLAVASAGGERQLAREAERTQALITYACEQAELTGRETGISVATRGLEFSRLDHESWRIISGDELRPRAWAAAVSATLTRDGHRVAIDDRFPDKPQLVCFSSGELTPFRLELRLPDLQRYYGLDGQPDGAVTLASVDGRER